MLTAISNSLKMPHQVVTAFESAGFPLNKKLEGMLNEDPEHQRPRRGCGYTQASRVLAEFVNQERGLTPELDLRLFSEVGQRKFACMLTVAHDQLHFHPKTIPQLHATMKLVAVQRADVQPYADQLQKLRTLDEDMELEESRLITKIILSILGVDVGFDEASASETKTRICDLPFCDEKLAIGTCPEAERYFLEFSGSYLRRNGIINVFTDDNNRPVLVEKMNVGDSHSCISIAELSLNGVHLPIGSLLGTRYSSVPLESKRCAEMNGSWLPLSVCQGFRFLRLSTLSVSPKNRARAFGNHLKKQLEGSPFFDPLNTSMSDIERVALKQRPR